MNGMDLTEDEAYSLITVGSDFVITRQMLLTQPDWEY
jgi:hypothetical protein